MTTPPSLDSNRENQAVGVSVKSTASQYVGTGAILAFRIAPSLITRGEAELFGLSSPRFALRVNLGKLGIINVRRLVTFNGRAKAQQLVEELDADLDATLGTCIADSLICLPGWCKKRGFQAIPCHLSSSYGEELVSLSTPFMQHMPLGGGVCAQAACFMILSCYADVANFVPCVAEITHFCGNKSEKFDLGGMTPTQIVNFFNNYSRISFDASGETREERIGLHASWQSEVSSKTDGQKARVAMQSYLESNVPLILPVDMNRMWGARPDDKTGSSVTRRGHPDQLLGNRVPRYRDLEKGELPQSSDHMVVIVGWNTKKPGEFLVNDPASYPFVPASFERLIASRQYQKNSDVSEGKLNPFGFISVTPAAVKLMLLPEARDAPQEASAIVNNKAGLLELVELLKNKTTPEPSVASLPHSVGADWPGRFRLVDLGADDSEIEASLASFVPSAVKKKLLELLRDGGVSRGWRWLQWLNPNQDINVLAVQSLWVWNAEKEPVYVMLDDRDPPEDFLEFVLSPKNGVWTKAHVNNSTSVNKRPPKRLTDPGQEQALSLDFSIVSSFTPRGIASTPCGFHALRECANVRQMANEPNSDNRMPVELYAFMEPEVEHYRRNVLSPNSLPNDAAGFLAGLAPKQTMQIAEMLSDQFAKEECQIVALASFLPEIIQSSSPESVGVKAVQRLIEIAHILKDNGHNVRVLELVAGSRVKGLRLIPGEKGERRRYSVSLYSVDTARDRLIGSLKEIVSKFETMRVCLSLELEPGPFFVLGNSEALLGIAELIDNPANWKDPDENDCLAETRAKSIGFNLDIGHWNIAGIDPDWICSSTMARPIRERIVHAHVGGHHRAAHFGDAPMVNRNGVLLNHLEDLIPWSKLLERIHRDKNRNMPFSGYLSLELEAAKSVEQVVQSFKKLHEIWNPRRG